MSHSIEDRLRDAYQAKTAQLTEQRLDQLVQAREQGLDDLLGSEHTAELPVLDFEATPLRNRQHRWIAPGLAAAAVAALAVGVFTVTGIQHEPKPRPNPPASRVSTPPPSSSAPTPQPSASQQTVAAPPYLPAGQTGSRDQVPWSVVGSGWRLLVPVADGDSVAHGASQLYLYDPAGGRYLISDRLPTGSMLLAWSPDGRRALLETGSSETYHYRELDLHTGVETAGFSVPHSNFVSYTQPRGLAIIVQQLVGQQIQLIRYSGNGMVEHRYARTVGTPALLYLPAGAEFIGSTDTSSALFRNDGPLVRSYQVPSGYRDCGPVRWWRSDSFLERCVRSGQQGWLEALFLQSVTGGAPTLLTDAPGKYQMGHWEAWPLSNGDILLANAAGCGTGGYEVLATDGSIRPLRGPAGVGALDPIVNMDGDLATFLQHEGGCSVPSRSRMIDYNMITGRTSTLFAGRATVLSWPGDPS